MNESSRQPDFIILPREDGKWQLTREGETPTEDHVFESLSEALIRGRVRAREENVRLRVQDIGEDAHSDHPQ